MNFYSKNKNRIGKIAVLRALNLGDLLCLVPSLRALRKAFPRSKIILIGLPWAETFRRRFSSYLDGFRVFPGFPGLPESKFDMEQIKDFFSTAKKEKFDLALQMHGSGRIVNRLVSFLGARETAGFFTDDSYNPRTGTYLRWPDKGHEILRMQRLLKYLGIPLDGDHLELPIYIKEYEEFMRTKRQYGLEEKNYVCVHPGARLATRRWSPKKFSMLIKMLASEKMRVVVTGSREEKDYIKERLGRLPGNTVNLSGKTSLGNLGLILKNSRLLISNDTGVSHVAAAMKTPSLLIVTGSDPDRWVPLDKKLHSYIYHPVPCRPCSSQTCPKKMPCSSCVQVGVVYQYYKEMIGRKNEKI